MSRITFIGAGSDVFAKNLLADYPLASRPGWYHHRSMSSIQIIGNGQDDGPLSLFKAMENPQYIAKDKVRFHLASV